MLFVAGMEMSVAKKHEDAIAYMEKRGLISPEKKSALKRVFKEFGGAEHQYQNGPSEAAKDRLEKAKEALGKEVGLFNEQSKKPAAGERTSTDYDFQILAEDSVEKVFGRVFARLIRGVKSRKPFKVPGEKKLRITP